MAILKNIPILLLPLALSSCYEDFTPDVDTKPVLCIMSEITAGSPIEVDVSHSWLFNDKEAQEDHSVKDAKVFIYANGNPVDEDYIAKEGDEIRIVADSPTYGSAEGVVRVPEAATAQLTDIKTSIADAVRYSGLPMDAHVSFNLDMSLKVTDYPGADNYFGITFATEYPSLDPDESTGSGSGSEYYVWLLSGYMTSFDPIFTEHIGPNETIIGADEVYGLMFTDRQFPGKSYTLRLECENFSYDVKYPEYDEDLYDCDILLTFHTISQSEYNYNRYYWRMLSGSADMADMGFGEPEWAYSNVSTGAGLISAQTVSTFRIPLKDFLKAAIENAPEYYIDRDIH